MKYTISVGKAYKHRGIHEHRTAKKHWFHYFFDENLVFHSEPISYLKAQVYKLKKKHYNKTFYCKECGKTFQALLKDKDQDVIQCPYCVE